MRQTRHVQNLASLRQKGAYVGTSIHGASENIGMVLGRLRFPDQAAKNSSQCHGLFHCATRRGRGQSLQMEW